MKNFFFISGLPRSKTAWLANFLSGGNTICLHDAFTRCARVEDLKAIMENLPYQNVGHADPANLLFSNRLREVFPQAKWVLVNRDPFEARQSCAEAFGVDTPLTEMFLMDSVKSAMHVDFDLVEHRAMEIAEFVAPGFVCHPERLNMLANFNVQLQREYIAENMKVHMNNPIFKEAV